MSRCAVRPKARQRKFLSGILRERRDDGALMPGVFSRRQGRAPSMHNAQGGQLPDTNKLVAPGASLMRPCHISYAFQPFVAS